MDREGRVMTEDLSLEGQRTLRLGSAYFPATGASSDERQAFYNEMTRYSVGGEPRANTADVEPQKGGFYSGLTLAIKKDKRKSTKKPQRNLALRARACFWSEAPPFFPRSHSHREDIRLD